MNWELVEENGEYRIYRTHVGNGYLVKAVALEWGYVHHDPDSDVRFAIEKLVSLTFVDTFNSAWHL